MPLVGRIRRPLGAQSPAPGATGATGATGAGDGAPRGRRTSHTGKSRTRCIVVIVLPAWGLNACLGCLPRDTFFILEGQGVTPERLPHPTQQRHKTGSPNPNPNHSGLHTCRCVCVCICMHVCRFLCRQSCPCLPKRKPRTPLPSAEYVQRPEQTWEP